MSEQTKETMLTPAEVGEKFGVDPKTVVRWADKGKIKSVRTLGGHRRFRASEVEALLNPVEPEPTPEDSDD